MSPEFITIQYPRDKGGNVLIAPVAAGLLGVMARGFKWI
jgi:hypothetical protein